MDVDQHFRALDFQGFHFPFFPSRNWGVRSSAVSSFI